MVGLGARPWWGIGVGTWMDVRGKLLSIRRRLLGALESATGSGRVRPARTGPAAAGSPTLTPATAASAPAALWRAARPSTREWGEWRPRCWETTGGVRAGAAPLPTGTRGTAGPPGPPAAGAAAMAGGRPAGAGGRARVAAATAAATTTPAAPTPIKGGLKSPTATWQPGRPPVPAAGTAGAPRATWTATTAAASSPGGTRAPPSDRGCSRGCWRRWCRR